MSEIPRLGSFKAVSLCVDLTLNGTPCALCLICSIPDISKTFIVIMEMPQSDVLFHQAWLTGITLIIGIYIVISSQISFDFDSIRLGKKGSWLKYPNKYSYTSIEHPPIQTFILDCFFMFLSTNKIQKAWKYKAKLW